MALDYIRRIAPNLRPARRLRLQTPYSRHIRLLYVTRALFALAGTYRGKSCMGRQSGDSLLALTKKHNVRTSVGASRPPPPSPLFWRRGEDFDCHGYRGVSC